MDQPEATTETTPAPPDAMPASLGWVQAVTGLGLAWTWVRWSPLVLRRLTVSSDLAAVAVFYLVLFLPLALLALGLVRASGLRTRLALARPGAWSFAGLVMGAAGLGCGALFAWLHGGLRPGADAVPPVTMLAAGLGFTLFQVTAEELLFRGWLQPLLMRLAGAWPGLLLGAAAFAGVHLASGMMPVVSIANIALAGLLFGLLAWRSGGLAAPVAAHFGWNAMEDLGLGLTPNPGVGPFGALHNVDVAGAALWGGGEDGLNGSIGTTLVLLALALPLLVRARPATRQEA